MNLDIDSRYPLTDEQITSFQENGFIKLAHVLSPEVIDHYGREITRLTIELNTQTKPIAERDTYDKAFLQVMNLWQSSIKVREFVLGKRLGRIATELLNVIGVRLYHDQSLYKEPGGGMTPAHADQYYWPLASDRTVTAWIPLQAVPCDMGPLAFFEGTQRFENGRNLGISDESERQISANMLEHGFNLFEQAFDVGDVSFHLGWTFHRAGSNSSQQPRSVMTMIYIDHQMTLAEPVNRSQQRDLDQWCPGAEVGKVIKSPKNLMVYAESVA